MNPNDPTARTVEQARARAGQLQGLNIHLAVAIAVSVLVTTIDIVTGNGWWFWWPIGGLAVSVIVHAVMVLRPPRLLSQERVDDKTAELVDTHTRRQRSEHDGH